MMRIEERTEAERMDRDGHQDEEEEVDALDERLKKLEAMANAGARTGKGAKRKAK